MALGAFNPEGIKAILVHLLPTKQMLHKHRQDEMAPNPADEEPFPVPAAVQLLLFMFSLVPNKYYQFVSQ